MILSACDQSHMEEKAVQKPLFIAYIEYVWRPLPL